MKDFVESFVRRVLSFYAKVLKFILNVIKTSSIFTLVIVTTISLIVTMSLVAVIIDDTISFTADEENLVATPMGNGGYIDPNDPDYFYLVAQALDKDKINKDYKSSPQMKNFFDELKIGTTSLRNSVEYPGKDIDIYELCCEILKRPEINGPNFDSDVLMEFILGNWACESTKVMGSGERLNKSELTYFRNGAGYCDPLGQHYNLYLTSATLADGNSVGCSYISKSENSSIPDEQRAIFNSNYCNISASDISNRVMYPTAEAPFRISDGIKTASRTDAAIKHLLGCKISGGGNITNRGSFTWLADSFYTAFYANRVMNEGRDRDTHNQTERIKNNNLAIKKLCSDAGLDRKGTSVILGIFAASNRFFKWEAQTLKGQTPEYNTGNIPSEGQGLIIYTYLVMYGEGALDDIVVRHKSKDILSNTILIEEMFGNPKLGGGSQIYESSAYNRLSTSKGSFKHKYNADTLSVFDFFRGYYAYSDGQSPFGQRGDNINYPGLSYIYGSMVKRDLETMVQAYYDFTDAAGNHPYRLFEVAAQPTDGLEQHGTGPFGIEYYNSDGTCNEANLTLANKLFSDLAHWDNYYKEVLTIPATYTITYKDKPYTVKLNGGKETTIPNFWGKTGNDSCPDGNWGQCTWWARGRAQLWYYENKSKDKEKWELKDVTAGWCGDGSLVASNVNSYGRFKVLFGEDVYTNMQDSTAGCTGSAGGTHIFFTEAYDKKNNIVFQTHGNIGYSKCQWDTLSGQGDTGPYEAYWKTDHYAEPGTTGSGTGYSYLTCMSLDTARSSSTYNYGSGLIILREEK